MPFGSVGAQGEWIAVAENAVRSLNGGIRASERALVNPTLAKKIVWVMLIATAIGLPLNFTGITADIITRLVMR
jgi:hypothetical protein